MPLELLGLAGLRDKLIAFYINYNSAYDHQTWQDGEYLEGLLPKSHTALESCGLAKSRDKLKPLYINYQPAYSRKPCRMLTYHEGFHISVWSNNPARSLDTLKTSYLHYHTAHGLHR